MGLVLTKLLETYDTYIYKVEKRVKLTKRLNKILFVAMIANFILSIKFGAINFFAGLFSLGILMWSSNTLMVTERKIEIYKELRADCNQEILHQTYNGKK